MAVSLLAAVNDISSRPETPRSPSICAFTHLALTRINPTSEDRQRLDHCHRKQAPQKRDIFDQPGMAKRVSSRKRSVRPAVVWRSALAGGTGCWTEGGTGGSGGQPHRIARQQARTLPSHGRSRLPPRHSFAAADAQRPICAAGSRSRRAASPRRPAIRQAAGRPQPDVVCCQDHNGAGRSATRRQLPVSMGLRLRSSMVSTSFIVDTIPAPSLRNLLCAVNCALTI